MVHHAVSFGRKKKPKQQVNYLPVFIVKILVRIARSQRTRHGLAKKRSLRLVNEHFEAFFQRLYLVS